MTACISAKQKVLTQDLAASIIQRHWRGRRLLKLPLKPHEINLDFAKDLLPQNVQDLATMICRVACLMPTKGQSSYYFSSEITLSTPESKELEECEPYPSIELLNPLIIEHDKANRQFFLHFVDGKGFIGAGTYKKVFTSRSIRIINGKNHNRHTVVSYLHDPKMSQLVQDGVLIERFAYADMMRLDTFHLPKFYKFKHGAAIPDENLLEENSVNKPLSSEFPGGNSADRSLKSHLNEVNLEQKSTKVTSATTFESERSASMGTAEQGALNLIIQTRYETTFLDYIKEGRGSYRVVLHTFLSILRDLKKLHKRGLIHNDIKLDNIMIDTKHSKLPLVYLGDWDLGEIRSLYAERKQITYCYWNSIRNLGYITNTTDIYAVVMCLSLCFLGNDFRRVFFTQDLNSLLYPKYKEELIEKILEKTIKKHLNVYYPVQFPFNPNQAYKDLKKYGDRKTLESLFKEIKLKFTAFNLLTSAIYKDKALAEWIADHPDLKDELNSEDQNIAKKAALEIESRFLSAESIEGYIHKMIDICKKTFIK